jgi:asparagine synthetase B (glutamine-hydrolysing)
MTSAPEPWVVAWDGHDLATSRSPPGAGGAVDARWAVAFEGALSAPFGESEVAIAAGYARSGERYLAGLRGTFALILADRAERRLVAARDKMGLTPLFYARAGGRWVFSTTLEALLRQEGVSGDVDDETVLSELSDRWLDAERTHFAAVKRVPPGSALVIDAAGLRVARYWDPSRQAQSPIRDPHDILDAFERTLRGAIADAMRPGGLAGIFLSGGVDSISVAALARSSAVASGAPLPLALSVLFSGSECDETDVQTHVASALGLPAFRVPLDEALGCDSAVDGLLALAGRWPIPMCNLWLRAFIRLAAEGTARGCDVVLTGGGGDEWLGVSPYVVADLLRALRIGAYLRYARQLRTSYVMSPWTLLRNVTWTFGVKTLLKAALSAVVRASGHDLQKLRAPWLLPPWLAPERSAQRAFRARVAESARVEDDRRKRMGSFYAYEARRSLDHPIVVTETENKFRLGQTVGVRFVEPYWSPEVVELLYGIAPDDLSAGGVAKGLVHGLIRRHLPDLPMPKQKKLGLAMFFRQRVRREMIASWRRLGGARALAAFGFVDARKVEDMVRTILADDASTEVWQVLRLACVESWLRARG